MNQKTVSEEIDKLAGALETVEKEFSEGRIPREGLKDFKAAVDNARTTVWGILSAAESEEYATVLARFRLNRIVEMCQQAVLDFESGTTPIDSPELQRFHTTLKDTLERTGILSRG